MATDEEILLRRLKRMSGSLDRRHKVVAERLDDLREQGLDIDPIRILAEIAMGRTLDGREITQHNAKGQEVPVEPAVRAKAASELASYAYPKLKAIEHSGNDQKPLVFTVQADTSPLPGEEGHIAMPQSNDHATLIATNGQLPQLAEPSVEIELDPEP